jgi:hypothetical protein
MNRFSGPLWRVAGSLASWLLFSLCFTLLYLGSSIVMGLGGFCASGGPYQIEVQCPDAVVAYVPLSIFGGLAAVALGAFLARGFGTPLVGWAWPILFLGLGTAFLIASAQPGGITFLICGVLFVVMGAVPLVLAVRADVRALFLGTTNAADEPFIANRAPRGTLLGITAPRNDQRDPVAPTPGDWALSLGILVAGVGLGVYLATLLFHATGG